MKRRVIVEVLTHGEFPVYQEALDYDSGPGALESAVQELVWTRGGLLSFAPIEGEDGYEGWSRCTINISGPICAGDDCLQPLVNVSHGDTWGQRCFECRDEAAS